MKPKPTEEAKQRAENYMSLKGALEPKQTVVDFIISQLKEEIRKSAHNQLGTNRTGDYRIGLVKAIDFCEQAKELEKEQMDKVSEDWFVEGCSHMEDNKRIYQSFEQYYNETFNTKKP
jgi:hypothetical protein